MVKLQSVTDLICETYMHAWMVISYNQTYCTTVKQRTQDYFCIQNYKTVCMSVILYKNVLNNIALCLKFMFEFDVYIHLYRYNFWFNSHDHNLQNVIKTDLTLFPLISDIHKCLSCYGQ